MTIEELKKLDQHIREIQYPFGDNFQQLCKTLSETAKQLNLSVSEVIRQYTDWRYSRE